MKKLKTIFLFLLYVSMLCSCQDTDIEYNQKSLAETQKDKKEQSVFLVFNSKGELAETISRMKRGERFISTRATRATLDSRPNVSIEDLQFVSLLEANKQQFLKSLSREQLDSIKNDEDEIEFCMSDSVIADYEFAQLLNASREIQVNDTVYKYFKNGVAFTHRDNALQLEDKAIEEKISRVQVSRQNEGRPIQLNGVLTFAPYAYEQIDEGPEIPAQPGDNNKHNKQNTEYGDEKFVLKNGVSMPNSSLRDVDYNTKGDGGWFHRTWNNLWGKNVLAINKFNKHKRLRLGFYDQNYRIYANIGVTMKMQKKVCGIWWNCRADEICIGWTAIELKYSFPSHVLSYLNPQVNPSTANESDYPVSFVHNFPFKNENCELFYLPFNLYNVKVKDVNKLLQSGMKTVINKGTEGLEQLINSVQKENRGLYSVDNSSLYVIIGGDEYQKSHCKTLSKKFYAKWLPGEYEVTFSYNGNFNVKSAHFGQGVKTSLSSGTVYGAVKYKGEWLAARITKCKE